MEKKKSASESTDSDRHFLEKCGALTQIKDLLTKVLENRPEDVVEFISEYFESSSERSDRVSRACRQIFLTHYTKPAYENNVCIAYDILCQNKGTAHIKGLSGSVYMEMMNLLCRQFPMSLREKLMKKVSCRDHEVVVFDVFRSSVFICVVLQDFVKVADELYTILDSKTNDQVDRLILNVVCQQLKDAVIRPTDNPLGVLEAGYLLAPDRVYSALASAMFRGGSAGSKSRDEFIEDITDIFVLKVNGLN